MDTTIQPTFIERFQAKLAASRFFTFSLLLHVVIILLVGTKIITSYAGGTPDFAAEGGGGLVAEEVAAEQPPPAAPQVQQQFTPQTPTVATQNLDVITAVSTSPTAFQIAPSMPQVKAPPAADMSKDISKAAAAMGAGMGKLPSTMAGRAGGTARMAAMTKMGGKEKSEKAVLAGLRWLKANQSPDGSWSKQYSPAMTGLAVLCFLGHGEIPSSPEFGPTVKKGVDFLLNKGVEFQGKLSMEKTFSSQGVYMHAIGAYALGEYYTMTKD